MSARSATYRRATLIGFTAVLMWGALALLTVWSGRVPPFQLVAMCFTVGEQRYHIQRPTRSRRTRRIKGAEPPEIGKAIKDFPLR